MDWFSIEMCRLNGEKKGEGFHLAWSNHCRQGSCVGSPYLAYIGPPVREDNDECVLLLEERFPRKWLAGRGGARSGDTGR